MTPWWSYPKKIKGKVSSWKSCEWQILHVLFWSMFDNLLVLEGITQKWILIISNPLLGYRGEKGRTLGKGYGIKWGAIGNTLGEKHVKCIENLRNIIWNIWEHAKNMMKHKNKKNSIHTTPHLQGKKIWTHLGVCLVISLAPCIFYS